jgi:hypothetical protein
MHAVDRPHGQCREDTPEAATPGERKKEGSGVRVAHAGTHRHEIRPPRRCSGPARWSRNSRSSSFVGDEARVSASTTLRFSTKPDSFGATERARLSRKPTISAVVRTAVATASVQQEIV